MSHATEGARADERLEHDAIVKARHRLELQRQAVGERHPDYATGLNQLALLLIMHGNPEHSEPLLRQALEIRKELLGERHPDYATNLSSLAGLLWARGDLDGAEPLMRHALAVRWEVFGSGHPKTTASLNSLEQLLRAKQDWEGIEQLAAGPTPVHPPVTPPLEPKQAAAPPSSSSSPAPVAAPPPASPDATLLPVDAAPAARPAEPETRELPARPTEERLAPPPVATGLPEPTRSSQPAAASDDPVTAAALAEGQARVGLIARHETLAAQFSRVGEQLAREAEEWKSGGAPPTPGLIEALDVCGRDFERLRGDVVRLAHSLGTAIEPVQLTNLQEISDLLHVLGEAEGRQAQLEALRSQALATLDRVLTLGQADQKEFAPLLECQARARAIRTSIADAPVLELPEEATRLAEGDHPFHALLTLVEGDGLDDDVWATSLETVEAEFGKALSVAVARSKIIQP